MVPVTDDGIYRFRCRRGHDAVLGWVAFKFEVLFEVSVNAIADHYYREAVASSTAALERFYEFFFRTVCLKTGIIQGEVDAAWSRVNKQSERQLGLYIACYLSQRNVMPPLMPESQKRKNNWEPSVSFRNSVIHKGEVPTRSQAIDYVNAVLGMILTPLDWMKGNLESEIMEMRRRLADDLQVKATPTGSVGGGTMINAGVHPVHNPVSISERLSYIEGQRRAFPQLWTDPTS